MARSLDIVARSGIVATQAAPTTLTKRADRLAELAPALDWPSNVWMGVSVENAGLWHRVNALKATDAAVKFVSIEPCLGPMGEPGRLAY